MLLPLFLRINKTWKRIELEDIIGLKTEGNYTYLLLRNNTEPIFRITMTEALKKFPEGLFVKTDRGYAASIYHIINIDKDKLELRMSDKRKIPIGKNMYKEVIRQLIVFE